MAWFSGKVSLGGFPDLAGAVNKLSESVKNIEKNFDSALGFEEKSDAGGEVSSGLWPSAITFMGHKGSEGTPESSERPESSQLPSSDEEKQEVETAESTHSPAEKPLPAKEDREPVETEKDQVDSGILEEGMDVVIADPANNESDSQLVLEAPSELTVEAVKTLDASDQIQQEATSSQSVEAKSQADEVDHIEGHIITPDEPPNFASLHESIGEQMTGLNEIGDKILPIHTEASIGSKDGIGTELSGSHSATDRETETETAGEFSEDHLPEALPVYLASETVSESASHETKVTDKALDPEAASHETKVTDKALDPEAHDYNPGVKESATGLGTKVSDSLDSAVEIEKLKLEMKMMETALQGAARQAQAKADEIAKLMNENEQLKAVIEDLKRKSYEAETESLREEYHQRVAALERKVYALTKERDTLRREQSRKSDAAALLKEKDEIINQVMAEGEELSKKQAAQEAQIRKLRAQIREFEEEKKGLTTKLQVEENKVESIKRDKAATEKLLQETIEKHQAELATQKEYYTNALAAAKEAEALAEARANTEARTELEIRLREAEEREAMLVQALEELRQTLSRTEQQAVFREDMLRRDIVDIQKRYQASERRCEELITQVPESTRPLLRQIEAMQETTARRAEAWAAVERSLNLRLQEAEAKAAAAEEKERSVNERLSQTLSRVNVLEAQISCLRAEQTQLSRSIEKERQRAAENRQEYLAAKEQADTQEGRANQLEEEIKELRKKHKQELQDALAHRELLQQELERERDTRLELESTAHLQSSAVSNQTTNKKQSSGFENGNLTRRLTSASSVGSIEESYFLQASLDPSDSLSEWRNIAEGTLSPYYMKSMTPSAFEAAIRQKEGELASYMSRLASMEAIRDSLAEELVQMTEQCEKFRAEAAFLPGIRAELEALRRRHSSALELMGERDEELEELRADIVDLKEMYREQVNLLVNQIQRATSSAGTV